MKWNISYYNLTVQEKVLALPKKLLARYLRMTDTMLEHGPNLGMPHSRSMGDGLFELRIKAEEGIGRVFYCCIVKRNILVLHSFIKKTNKTPKKELEIAKTRLKEVKNV